MKIPIEKLFQGERSYYRLVLLAAKRANELAEGSLPLVKVQSKKLAVNALEEIAAGKVRCGTNGSEKSKKEPKSKKSEE